MLVALGVVIGQWHASQPGVEAQTRKVEAPQAKVVWCLTTPMRDGKDLTQFEEKNPRVLERNAIALELMTEAGIPVNDLYALVAEKQEYFGQDGVHFSEAGRAAQAQPLDAVLDLGRREIRKLKRR